MDYEKILKNALQSDKTPFEVTAWIEEQFPELAESEDEKIRTFLHKTFTLQYLCKDKLGKWHGEPVANILAWLEKQGEKDKLIKELGEYKVKYTQEVLSNHLEKQGEQKPAEWSEEDETGWTNTMIMIKECAANHYTKDSIALVVNWLKSLKDRVIPQPKVKWSKEDEKGLGDALWCCKQAASITKDENDMGNVWYAETWLKSLKDRYVPQLQEWSEDDEYDLEFILAHLREYLHEDAYVGYEKWLKDKLKSLRPQKQWKPTKEQLKELEIVAKDNHLNPNLQILLEQLKQL